MCMHIHICVCMYVYNKNNNNESLARIILLNIQVTGNILEHKQWNIMMKKKQRKEEVQEKQWMASFLIHTFQISINFTGVSWLLSPPNSSLPNYKAFEILFSKERGDTLCLRSSLARWDGFSFFLLFTYWILKIQGDTRVFTVICFV